MEYKKVLHYLYTATLVKIYNVKDYSGTNDLIIDIEDYLDSVKEEFETLRDLRKESNKADVIRKHEEEYKRSIDQRIEEANDFIQRLVVPEIDRICAQVDSKIDLLIDETIALQEQAKEEKEKLIEKWQELDKAMVTRGMFSFFKIAGQVISFFGPIGAIAGTALGMGTSVIESLVLDNEEGVLNLPSQVASGMQLLDDGIKNVKNQKIAYLDKLLEDIAKETSKYRNN
ncbi:uncharacterized protein CEXT_422391 [Caerostris extrusa]|uniref:Uncharacterized protein n=1 Tax=Caerostris extrusa TaxID=172846 RepID=A0AAV4U2F7_CAEEX|nr:uncharacterized protein CEXT_422391 [Caerostris extrusa]